MPIYEYQHEDTGRTLELRQSVEDRDNCPPRYRRVTVPRRIGFVQGLGNPTDVDAAAPRGLRQLEETIPGGAREIERQTGFSVAELKRTWSMALAFLFCVASCCGADITAGKIFTPGEKNIDHVKLNAVVGGAVINSTFITDKTATQTPQDGDVYLIYSIAWGDFRKTAMGSIFTNVSLLPSRSEELSPLGTDFLLLYRPSSGLFEKTAISNIVNSAAITGQTNWPTPNPTTFVIGYDSGAVSKLSVSNLFWHYANFAWFTNLAVKSTATNLDAIEIWDATLGTNQQVTLAGLATNPPIVTTLTNSDIFRLFSTATNAFVGSTGNVATVTLGTLQNYLTNVANSPTLTNKIPVGFTASYPALDASDTTNVLHGLPGTPQMLRWTFICTNSAGDLGYLRGDEIEPQGTIQAGSGTPAFNVGASSTNVYIVCAGAGWRVMNKTTQTYGTPTYSKWNLKAYAIFYP